MSVHDPAFAATRANAEAMMRDEPSIPVFPLRQDHVARVDVTVAVGSKPVLPIRIAAWRISSWTGQKVIGVEAGHEVYLSDPTVLTGIVQRGRRQA